MGDFGAHHRLADRALGSRAFSRIAAAIQGWRVGRVPVLGSNIRGIGLITFGENWHGNHHAFPHSARLGVEPGQLDPGFWFIRTLEWLGLASAIGCRTANRRGAVWCGLNRR